MLCYSVFTTLKVEWQIEVNWKNIKGKFFENIKELTSTASPILDLDLQTALQLPLEENSLLDLLIDSNIV